VSWDYGRLVAEVYELDKPVGSTFPALQYYTRQLAGVTGRILEPATGTGRVLVPLLEAGFAVEGPDVSPDTPPGHSKGGRGKGDRGKGDRPGVLVAFSPALPALC
jgi:phage tail protein X